MTSTARSAMNRVLIASCFLFKLLFAISGKNGQTLWEFENHIIQSDLMSIYAAQFVHDLNGDGIPEILAVHGGDELSDPGKVEHWMVFFRVSNEKRPICSSFQLKKEICLGGSFYSVGTMGRFCGGCRLQIEKRAIIHHKF